MRDRGLWVRVFVFVCGCVHVCVGVRAWLRANVSARMCSTTWAVIARTYTPQDTFSLTVHCDTAHKKMRCFISASAFLLATVALWQSGDTKCSFSIASVCLLATVGMAVRQHAVWSHHGFCLSATYVVGYGSLAARSVVL